MLCSRGGGGWGSPEKECKTRELASIALEACMILFVLSGSCEGVVVDSNWASLAAKKVV